MSCEHDPDAPRPLSLSALLRAATDQSSELEQVI